MFRSIQWRITIPLILLVLIIIGILGAYLSVFVTDSLVDSLRSRLENEARITAEASLPYFLAQDTSGGLDILAKKLGNQISTRVTIIAPDGTVLGDSHENPSIMENHSARPEVRDALALGMGESIRYSTTLGQKMMYVAVPVFYQDRVEGIARVALPLTGIESSTSQVTISVITAMAIAAVLVILAAWLIARVTTRPIRELTRASQSIASGDLEQRITVRTRDESGQLAYAFNDMALGVKRMVATVSDERNKLETVLSNMADGVIMADNEGNMILANPTAEILFDFKEENVTGRPLIEVVRDHEIDEIVKKCLETGKEQSSQLEFGTARKFLRVIAVPLMNDRLNGTLVLFQDLTELRSLQTMRQELVGNISHELRTPLAAIKAIVETLQDGAVNDEEIARNFLSKVNSEVERMTQIVTELTELSRIESGKVEMKLEPVDLDSLITEVIARLNPQATRQNVTLLKELHVDLPPVPANRERVQHVLTNLVHNAIKFNRPEGKVILSARRDGNSVVIDVSDTGIGISKEDLPHIFERFYKVDKARTGRGTGLGLAIAKHIIQAHGGNIWARSEEGKGSILSFSIPLK